MQILNRQIMNTPLFGAKKAGSTKPGISMPEVIRRLKKLIKDDAGLTVKVVSLSKTPTTFWADQNGKQVQFQGPDTHLLEVQVKTDADKKAAEQALGSYCYFTPHTKTQKAFHYVPGASQNIWDSHSVIVNVVP